MNKNAIIRQLFTYLCHETWVPPCLERNSITLDSIPHRHIAYQRIEGDNCAITMLEIIQPSGCRHSVRPCIYALYYRYPIARAKYGDWCNQLDRMQPRDEFAYARETLRETFSPVADGSRPVEWNRSNCDNDRPILVVITAEVVKMVRQWRAFAHCEMVKT